MPTHKVLYTRQKTQKNKRWTDGYLRVGDHGKLTLLDEEKKVLDSDFKVGKVCLGDELDFQSYLATVEELDENENIDGNVAAESVRRMSENIPPTYNAGVRNLGNPRRNELASNALSGPANPNFLKRRGPGLKRPFTLPTKQNAPSPGNSLPHAPSPRYNLPHERPVLIREAVQQQHAGFDNHSFAAESLDRRAMDNRGQYHSFAAESLDRGAMDSRGQCQRGTNDILALLGVGSTEPSCALEASEELHDSTESLGLESHGGSFGTRFANPSIKRARVDPYQHGHPQEPFGGFRQNPLFVREDRALPERGEHASADRERGGFQHARMLEDDVARAVSGYAGSGQAAHEQREEDSGFAEEPRQEGTGGFFALKRARDEEVNWKPLSAGGRGGGRLTKLFRQVSREGDAGGGGAVDEEAQAQRHAWRAQMSLKEEQAAHLQHDRQVQSKFWAQGAGGGGAGAGAGAGAGGGGMRAVLGAAAGGGGGEIGPRRSGGLRFPRLCECRQQTTSPRAVEIPDHFRTPAEYKAAFSAALEEEINMKIEDVATKYYAALQEVSGSAEGAVMCACKKVASSLTVKKEGKNQGRAFFSCGANRKCQFFQWADAPPPPTDRKQSDQKQQGHTTQAAAAPAPLPVALDTSRPPNLVLLRQKRQRVFKCEIVLSSFQPRKFGGKNRGESAQGPSKDEKISIRISDGVAPPDGCFKDDLWVLSSSPFFSEDPRAVVALVRSTWYTPDSDNAISIAKVEGNLGALRSRNVVYGLRGPNIGSEWDMLSCVKDLSPAQTPLMPALLHGGQRAAQSSTAGLKMASRNGIQLEVAEDTLAELLSAICTQFALNPEQRRVLEDVAGTFSESSSAPPVVLVHGVFGSGKSTTLVALILFLLSVFEAAGVPEDAMEGRVLVSAATNVAVDNILLGLMHRGYEDFVRVGCLRRIAKPILKHTLKETGSSEKVDQESLRELTEMLKKSNDACEARDIRLAINECKAGRMREKKKLLGFRRVVGVTCASTRQDVLANQKFGFVILDECSQYIEPLSLLPLSRFSCKVLVGAGDPMQLPPTLGGVGDMSASAEHPRDLSKTMFSRLAASGIEPVLLKRQYRCHPFLGTMASDLFYSSKLVNGVNAEQRAPLIATKQDTRHEWPPLVFFDLAGSGREVAQQGGSFVNFEEASYVVWLVNTLVRDGLDSKQIGVICLYKAQATQIQKLLSGEGEAEGGLASGVQVSTVDAFQGGEKDVILVSSCRTQSLGFITSPNRMNVAITRARRHLVVVGCGKTLPQNEHWRLILERAASLPGGKVAAREFRMSNPAIEVLHTEEADDDGSHGNPAEDADEPEDGMREQDRTSAEPMTIEEDEAMEIPTLQRTEGAGGGSDPRREYELGDSDGGEPTRPEDGRCGFSNALQAMSTESADPLQGEDDADRSPSCTSLEVADHSDYFPATGQPVGLDREDQSATSADPMGLDGLDEADADADAEIKGEDAVRQQGDGARQACDAGGGALCESPHGCTDSVGASEEAHASPTERISCSLTSSLPDLAASAAGPDRAQVLSQARTVQIPAKHKPAIPNFDLGSSSDEE